MWWGGGAITPVVLIEVKVNFNRTNFIFLEHKTTDTISDFFSSFLL